MSEKREFTGVFIPAHIWESELTPAEKMLLGEVIALSGRTGWCTAGRKHFADWLHCELPNVTYYIKKLEKMGFLEVVRTHGESNKMRVKSDAFYLGEVVNPVYGGSKEDLRGVVNPVYGGSKEDLPKIQDKENIEIQYKENSANAPDYLTLKAEKEKKAPPVPAAPPAPVFNPDGWRHPEEAAQAVATWLQYKRSEKKGSYKAQKSFDIAVGQWLRMFGGCGRTLQESVNQSISNGWSGLFPVKVNRPAQAARATGIQAWDNDRPELQQKQAF